MGGCQRPGDAVWFVYHVLLHCILLSFVLILSFMGATQAGVCIWWDSMRNKQHGESSPCWDKKAICADSVDQGNFCAEGDTLDFQTVNVCVCGGGNK